MEGEVLLTQRRRLGDAEGASSQHFEQSKRIFNPAALLTSWLMILLALVLSAVACMDLNGFLSTTAASQSFTSSRAFCWFQVLLLPLIAICGPLLFVPPRSHPSTSSLGRKKSHVSGDDGQITISDESHMLRSVPLVEGLPQSDPPSPRRAFCSPLPPSEYEGGGGGMVPLTAAGPSPFVRHATQIVIEEDNCKVRGSAESTTVSTRENGAGGPSCISSSNSELGNRRRGWTDWGAPFRNLQTGTRVGKLWAFVILFIRRFASLLWVTLSCISWLRTQAGRAAPPAFISRALNRLFTFLPACIRGGFCRCCCCPCTCSCCGAVVGRYYFSTCTRSLALIVSALLLSVSLSFGPSYVYKAKSIVYPRQWVPYSSSGPESYALVEKRNANSNSQVSGESAQWSSSSSSSSNSSSRDESRRPSLRIEGGVVIRGGSTDGIIRIINERATSSNSKTLEWSHHPLRTTRDLHVSNPNGRSGVVSASVAGKGERSVTNAYDPVNAQRRLWRQQRWARLMQPTGLTWGEDSPCWLLDVASGRSRKRYSHKKSTSFSLLFDNNNRDTDTSSGSDDDNEITKHGIEWKGFVKGIGSDVVVGNDKKRLRGEGVEAVGEETAGGQDVEARSNSSTKAEWWSKNGFAVLEEFADYCLQSDRRPVGWHARLRKRERKRVLETAGGTNTSTQKSLGKGWGHEDKPKQSRGRGNGYEGGGVVKDWSTRHSGAEKDDKEEDEANDSESLVIKDTGKAAESVYRRLFVRFSGPIVSSGDAHLHMWFCLYDFLAAFWLLFVTRSARSSFCAS